MKNTYESQIEEIEKIEKELIAARLKASELKPLQLVDDFNLLKKYNITVYAIKYYYYGKEMYEVIHVDDFEKSYILSKDAVKIVKKLDAFSKTIIKLTEQSGKMFDLIQRAVKWNVNWNNGFEINHPFTEMEKLIEKEKEN